MKVVITGSPTSSNNDHIISSWYFEYFKNHEVIQISRATGYDFNKNYDEIVSIAQSADIFVNNSCIKDFQIKLLQDVYDHVPYMIISGSVSGDFHEALSSPDGYTKIKQDLKKESKLLPLVDYKNSTKLLHLTLTELETPSINKKGLTYNQFSKVLDFWFDFPVFTNIDFKYFVENDDKKIKKVQSVVDYYRKK